MAETDLEFANRANIDAARRFKEQRDALLTAIEAIYGIAKTPIGLDERQKIKGICREALNPVGTGKEP